VLFYLDKVEEIIRACDKLLLTWKTHRPRQGDRKVKETMYRTISKMVAELEQRRDNSSTEDTLTYLTLIETSLDESRIMDSAILGEEEEATTEFPFTDQKDQNIWKQPSNSALVVRGDVTERPCVPSSPEHPFGICRIGFYV